MRRIVLLHNHLATILRLDLSRSRWFLIAPVEQVAQCYNGIGPEWMPRWLRRLVTRGLSRYEPAAIIHDWDFAMGHDRSEVAFDAANTRFHVNCEAIDRDLGITSNLDEILALCVRRGGWDAWESAKPPKGMVRLPE